MPDARVQSAIDNWASRLIANGVDYNDFVRTTGAIERWDEWLDAWTATAEVHRGLAEQELADGHRRSAGEAYLRAAISYHFSKFVWVIDPDRNRRATEAAAQALYDAHALLDTGAERIEAAIRRRPRGSQPAAAGNGRGPGCARRGDPGP